MSHLCSTLDMEFREHPSLLKKSVEGLWMDLNRVQRPKKWCHRGQKEAQKRVPESFSTRSSVIGSPYAANRMRAPQKMLTVSRFPRYRPGVQASCYFDG